MGELGRYGLLSLGSMLVLFLVLTFVGRDPEPREPIVRAVAGAAPWNGDAQLLRDPVHAAGSAPRVMPATGGERHGTPRSEPRLPAVRKGVDGGGVRPVMLHVVRPGETLSGIARKYLGSSRRWPELAEANAPLDPQKLRVGKVLRIPTKKRERRAAAATERSPNAVARPVRPENVRPRGAGRSLPVISARRHVIQKGDTLSSISNRYYGDYMQWKRIYNANRKRIPDARKLAIGTILDLP